jgi:hypothetical protein
MASIPRTRFLLLAASLKKDVGWWYVFVTPERLLEVQTGSLWYGLATHAALIVRYRSERREDQAYELGLVFADVDTRQRVIEDLRLDLGAGVLR